MNIARKTLQSSAVRLSVVEDGREVGRAYLFLIQNDLHGKPYGLLEDVFVEEDARGRGVARQLVHEIIEEAKILGCYKILATSRFSRPVVHEMYERYGFKKHGFEFRMDL